MVSEWTRHNQCNGIASWISGTFIVPVALENTMLRWLGRGEGVRAPKPTAAAAKVLCSRDGSMCSWSSNRSRLIRTLPCRGVFDEQCRDLGMPLVPVPADAHFAHDKVELRVQLVKNMAEKVFKDMDVRVDMEAKVAGARVGQTR